MRRLLTISIFILIKIMRRLLTISIFILIKIMRRLLTISIFILIKIMRRLLTISIFIRRPLTILIFEFGELTQNILHLVRKFLMLFQSGAFFLDLILIQKN